MLAQRIPADLVILISEGPASAGLLSSGLQRYFVPHGDISARKLRHPQPSAARRALSTQLTCLALCEPSDVLSGVRHARRRHTYA